MPDPACILSVAVLFEGMLNSLRVINRSFRGSGRPRGPRRPFQNVGGLRPPPFARVSGAPGAAQTFKMTDFRSLIKKHICSHPRCSHVSERVPGEAGPPGASGPRGIPNPWVRPWLPDTHLEWSPSYHRDSSCIVRHSRKSARPSSICMRASCNYIFY